MEDMLSVMPDLHLGMLLLTFEKQYTFLSAFRRQLKHFYFSHY